MFTLLKKGLFFSERVTIRRKIIEKKLKPTLTVFRNKLLPGEKSEWTVNIPEIKQMINKQNCWWACMMLRWMSFIRMNGHFSLIFVEIYGKSALGCILQQDDFR
jgi:hypothetical protein